MSAIFRQTRLFNGDSNSPLKQSLLSYSCWPLIGFRSHQDGSLSRGEGKRPCRYSVTSHSDKNNSEASLIQAQKEFRQVNEQAILDKALLGDEGKMIIFKKASYRKRVLCGMATMFLSQSTGVLVINNYQVSLYNGLGLYGSLPLLLYAIYLT